jgi:YhcH/YjgK/YiaL family protein
MKNLFVKIMVLTSLLAFFGCKPSDNPAKWSKKQLNTWFDKGEWLGGWTVKPDATINRKEFAISYYNHKTRWDKTFAFLRESDLHTLELKKYELDGTDLYAPVSEYITKNEENARYEAHKKYIDVQYVISGKELIGIAPVSLQKEIIEPYNDQKDVMFVTVSQIINFKADSSKFFIFFPDDLHRPSLKDGENSHVRKVVVKVKVD